MIATGPLTSPALVRGIRKLTGEEYLYFLRCGGSDRGEGQHRYGQSIYRLPLRQRGGGLYQLSDDARRSSSGFMKRSSTPKRRPLKEFEKEIYFEGCMPIEVMATAGKKNDPVRSDEAGGTHRSPNRKTALRRGSVASGQRSRHALQPGRLSDPSEMGGAEAGIR